MRLSRPQPGSRMLGRILSLRPRDPVVIISTLKAQFIGVQAHRAQDHPSKYRQLIGLLKTETDPTKRAIKTRLLAEEESKQKQLPPYDKNEPKAF